MFMLRPEGGVPEGGQLPAAALRGVAGLAGAGPALHGHGRAPLVGGVQRGQLNFVEHKCSKYAHFVNTFIIVMLAVT